MSLDVALAVARSGLSHTQRQLANSADNVANAGTAGYTRKTVEGRSEGVGEMRSGVRSLAARRDVDAALVADMNAARSAMSAAGVRESVLLPVERAHGDPGNADSLSDLTAALEASFLALREGPSEVPRQNAVVAAADHLAARTREVSGAIGRARQAAHDGMVDDVASLNAMLREVAVLNEQIRPLAASNRSTASLEDQRDAAVARIAAVVQVRAVPGADGGVSLFARGGLQLPLSVRGDAFAVAPAALGATASHAGGAVPGVMLGGHDVTAQLLGGGLAERVRLRDEVLPLQQAEIDASAAALASRFEAQGLRLFGAEGEVPAPAAPPPGYASSLRVNAAVLQQPSLVRDGTHAVADAPAGASGFDPNPVGGPAGFGALIDRVLDRTFGAEVRAGVPQPGFPATGLGPDGTLVSGLGAARTLGDYAARLVSAHTAGRAAATEARAGAADMLAGLAARFDDRSGVDVDAEMAAMVSLQNAYASNARVMSTVQAMFDALLAAVR